VIFMKNHPNSTRPTARLKLERLSVCYTEIVLNHILLVGPSEATFAFWRVFRLTFSECDWGTRRSYTSQLLFYMFTKRFGNNGLKTYLMGLGDTLGLITEDTIAIVTYEHDWIKRSALVTFSRIGFCDRCRRSENCSETMRVFEINLNLVFKVGSRDSQSDSIPRILNVDLRPCYPGHWPRTRSFVP
jgi:hypothetical protein